MVVKVFSALVAFLSGIITLVLSTYFDEKETIHIFEGASAFLRLRDQADLVLSRPDTSDEEAYTSLERLTEAYARHSAEYDHFILGGFDSDGIDPRNIPRESLFHRPVEERDSIPIPRYPPRV
jgi:hypothetical protein